MCTIIHSYNHVIQFVSATARKMTRPTADWQTGKWEKWRTGGGGEEKRGEGV